MTTATTADRLQQLAPTLAQRALAAMLANPFWHERYGERAKRFGGEDGNYHVSYLVESLRTGAPEVIAQYARWLQPLLVTRGMCSAHLAENFALLADAIRAEGAGDDAAFAHLRAAEDALRYPSGPARVVQEHAEHLATRVADAVRARDPRGPDVNPAGPAGRAPHEVRYYASYLADALAMERPALLSDYVRYVAEHLARHGGSRAHVALTLDALRDALDELPDDARRPARDVLDAARSTVG